MHDELVKALHETDFSDGCPCGAEPMCKDRDCVILQAADAIEKLSKQREYWELEASAQETDKNYLIDENRKLAEAWHNALDLRNRWIPVKEQLIHSGWYLVACNEWGGSAVRKAVYDEATRKWLEFPCGGPKDITKFVTHYMPLPEPPKEE